MKVQRTGIYFLHSALGHQEEINFILFSNLFPKYVLRFNFRRWIKNERIMELKNERVAFSRMGGEVW